MKRVVGAVDYRNDISTYVPSGSGGGVSFGAYADLPASGTSTGEVYQCTDVALRLIWDGSQWQAFYHNFNITLPSASGWSWTNQDSATANHSLGLLQLGKAGRANSDSVSFYGRSAPSTPYTITTLSLMTMQGYNYSAMGVGFRESSSSKLIVWRPLFNNDWNFQIWKLTNPTTSSSAPLSVNNEGNFHWPYWIRFSDDGADLTFEMSWNKSIWHTLWTEARGTFFSTAPDEVGPWLDARNLTTPGFDAYHTLLSWEEA